MDLLFVRLVVVLQKAGQRQYDLATRGRRNPGSSFKPFGLIAALEQGIPLNSYWDYTEPQVLEFGGIEPWECSNAGTNDPGIVTLEQGKALTTPPEGTPRVKDAAGKPLGIFSGCGVMAEYATLSVDNLVKIDSKIPLDRAALVGCAVTTGVGAVFNTAKVEPGASVAVFGCGGVGLNVVQGAAIAGAERIIAIDTLQEKLDMAKRFGATDTILAKPGEDTAKALKKLTGGGPDYAFECVGAGALAETAYRAIRRGGKAVIVGVARPTDAASFKPMTMVFEEKCLQGSYFGSSVPRIDFPRMLQLYMAGRLKLDELITHRYRIDEAPQAFADLESGRNARGVIVF